MQRFLENRAIVQRTEQKWPLVNVSTLLLNTVIQSCFMSLKIDMLLVLALRDCMCQTIKIVLAVSEVHIRMRT